MKLKQTVAIIVIVTASIVVATVPSTVHAASCGGADTAIIECGNANGENAVMWLLLTAINILAVGVGIAAVGGIVWAAIIYATAGANAGQVVKAKNIILNVVIGVVAYGLMFSLLNFLIPGGIFKPAVIALPTIIHEVQL